MDLLGSMHHRHPQLPSLHHQHHQDNYRGRVHWAHRHWPHWTTLQLLTSLNNLLCLVTGNNQLFILLLPPIMDTKRLMLVGTLIPSPLVDIGDSTAALCHRVSGRWDECVWIFSVRVKSLMRSNLA